MMNRAIVHCYAVVKKYIVVGIDLQNVILALEYTTGRTLKLLPAFWTSHAHAIRALVFFPFPPIRRLPRWLTEAKNISFTFFHQTNPFG